MLKHRLLCDEPATLDELLSIADKYATADSSMKTKLQVDASGKMTPPTPKMPAGESTGASRTTTISARPRRQLLTAGWWQRSTDGS